MRKTTDRKRVRDRRRRRRLAAPSTSARAAARCAARGSSCCRRTAASPPPCNRGLALAPAGDDVVVLNSDVIAQPRLARAAAVHGATATTRSASSGPSCSTPTSGSSPPAPTATSARPEWFDHRYRFKDADAPGGEHHRAGARRRPARACTSSAPRSTRSAASTRATAWPTRTWTAACAAGRPGWRTLLRAARDAAAPRVADAPDRAGRARARLAALLLADAGAHCFDERDVRTPDGRLRVVYVTEDTGVGGGHRDIFEHLNRLAARGHDARAVLARRRSPTGSTSTCPTRTFEDYDELLARARADVDAIKVATWWNTAAPGLAARPCARGIPVFFVQDIETSYYPRHAPRCRRTCWRPTARSSAT